MVSQRMKQTQKVRECMNPDCDWKGTREEALGPYKRPGKNQYKYWACPECCDKIQSDTELKENRRYRIDRDKIFEQMINWLKENGREFGIKITEMAERMDPNHVVMHEIIEKNPEFELIELSSAQSDRVRLVRKEVGF